MGAFSTMLCRRDIAFIFLGLTIGALVASAQQEVPVEFQKCVTSCTDANGVILRSGNYPDCDQCNDFVQCFSGNKAIQHCPLGTNYFNRKLGVCDSDINVCVNDSLSTTTATTTRDTTTSTTSTTQETTNSTVAPATTAQVPNTTAITTTTQTTTLTSLPTTAALPETPPTTTSVLPTTTITTAALPATTTTTLSTTSMSTTVTLVTTTSTTTSSAAPTTTVTAFTNSTGYTPRSGAEADSFWFAVDLYNKNSLETTRAGAQTVDSLTAENDKGATYYRIYGVTLVQTTCPNKPEFTKADYTKCPLMTSTAGNRNQYFVAKCGFKVRYTPPTSTAPVKLDMIYMMCSK